MRHSTIVQLIQIGFNSGPIDGANNKILVAVYKQRKLYAVRTFIAIVEALGSNLFSSFTQIGFNSGPLDGAGGTPC